MRSFKDNRIRIYNINNDGIIARSRNLGIENSHGEYIAFLDSDDSWTPDKLESAQKYIKDGYDFIYHSLWIKNETKPNFFKKKIGSWQIDSPAYNDLINNGNPIATSGVVVSKESIDKVGGFSEDKDLIAGEDYDCWVRISKHTEKFKFINKPKGFWYFGDNTTSPLLTAKYLRKLYQLYLINVDKNSLPVWYLYSLSRSLYLMEDCLKAQETLKLILKRKTSYMIKAKVLFMLILNSFKVRKLT